eukprot:SAG11_NODE_1584_length_4643_cov_8.930238_1_plen_104_part_00
MQELADFRFCDASYESIDRTCRANLVEPRAMLTATTVRLQMQFRQVLAKVDLAVSAEEAKLLMKQYGVSAGAVNGGGFINYNLFCETLQPPPPHINPWKTTTL